MVMSLLLGLSCLVTGCASPGKLTKHEEMKIVIEKAKQGAVFNCTTQSQCNKAFILAKLFVARTSDMNIRYSGDEMVLTHTPEYGGTIGMAAQKIPDIGESANITLIVSCKHMDMMTLPGTYPFFDKCAERMLSAYTGFKPFIESRLH
jgi:hypothetical protein